MCAELVEASTFSSGPEPKGPSRQEGPAGRSRLETVHDSHAEAVGTGMARLISTA